MDEETAKELIRVFDRLITRIDDFEAKLDLMVDRIDDTATGLTDELASLAEQVNENTTVLRENGNGGL